ncbi:kinase domain protein [Aspergillus pseudodeflectus]|uniref:non-specific serine/threonine protein kinase n=1 Tax=Aspergillus pseudodeflectus TaxID=176178 RepID=A0ABR4JRF1_9EURO
MSSSAALAESSPFQYAWIDGAENLERYSPGGYHPVMIGDVLHSKYRIVDKLGCGGYSTVWLAWDNVDRRYLALKIGIADAALQETDILRKLSSPSPSSLALHGRSFIPILFDEFQLHGPNGTHQCYAMPAARCDLREISYSRLFSLEVARALCGRLTLAIAYMHSQGYAHGDIHLRNVLLKLPSTFDHLSVEEFYEEYGEPQSIPVTEQDGKPLAPNVPANAVIPIRLGEAFAPDLQTRLGKDSHIAHPLRPPEARFEPEKPLMEFVTPDEAISQRLEVLGPMPKEWFERWENRARFFDDEGRPTPEFGPEETMAIVDLMRRMLAFRPEERPSVEEILQSEWMVK